MQRATRHPGFEIYDAIIHFFSAQPNPTKAVIPSQEGIQVFNSFLVPEVLFFFVRSAFCLGSRTQSLVLPELSISPELSTLCLVLHPSRKIQTFRVESPHLMPPANRLRNNSASSMYVLPTAWTPRSKSTSGRNPAEGPITPTKPAFLQ